MTDFSKPTTTSLKADFPAEIRNAIASVGKMDFSGDTNVPTNFLQWNRSSKLFQQYNGATWDTSNVHDILPNKTGAESISGVWSFSSAASLMLPTLVNWGANDTVFRSLDPDGTDGRSLSITPAGGIGKTRGAYVQLYGNEHANAGLANFGAGGNTGGTFVASTNGLFLYSYGTGFDATNGPGLYLHNSTAGGGNAKDVHLHAGTDGRVLLYSSGSNGKISFEQAGAAVAQFVGGELRFNKNDFLFRADTSPGADNKSLTLSGGGNYTGRGAYLSLYGNNHSVRPGEMWLASGATTGSAITMTGTALNLLSSSTTFSQSTGPGLFLYNTTSGWHPGSVDIYNATGGIIRNILATANTSEYVSFEAGGAESFRVMNHLVRTAQTDFIISPLTNDASDNKCLLFSAGGIAARTDVSNNRGSYLWLRGNEYNQGGTTGGFSLIGGTNFSCAVMATGNGRLTLSGDEVWLSGNRVNFDTGSNVPYTGTYTVTSKYKIKIGGTEYAILLTAV
jgi:hypothetical protein